MEPKEQLIQSKGVDAVEAMKVMLGMSKLNVQSLDHGYQSPNGDIANAAHRRVGEPGSRPMSLEDIYEAFYRDGILDPQDLIDGRYPINQKHEDRHQYAVAVLPCGHVFHCECLELLTPLELAADPPCFDCADGLH